jgi:hypothetical protein
MANEAFMAGFNSQKKGKQPQGATDSAADAAKSGPKAGLISKGISAIKGKMGSSKGGASYGGAGVGGDPAKAALAGVKLFKKGGPVKKTGLALLHKGEYVVPAKHGHRKKSSGKQRTTIKP